ncbi:MAG: hypothetical protein WCI51_02135 [Lentisphaerota bacterium]
MKDLKPGQIGCVESKYNELDIYEQAEKGFNVGIGSIKFDLTAEQKQYIQGEKRPAVEDGHNFWLTANLSARSFGGMFEMDNTGEGFRSRIERAVMESGDWAKYRDKGKF